MSLNYTNQYIQSILSYIDYTTFDGSDGKENLLNKDYLNPTDKQAFLNRVKEYIDNPITYAEMESSLEFFTNHFKIINQETAPNSNGFTGTTYQLISPIEGSSYNVGELFVSYTGTEAESGDYLTDIKLTFSDSITFNTSQEPLALEYLKNTLNGANGNIVNISGHSLGGYLAARSYYYLTTEEIKKIGEVTTFNGAGFSVLDGALDPVKRELYEKKINNIFSYRGLNVTTSNVGEIDVSNALKGSWTLISTFQHLGPRIGVFTENPGGWKGNHSMSMLVNTMGFYSILSRLIIDVFYVKDDNGIEYLGDDAVVYWVNKLLSGAFYDTVDFGQAYNTLASKIMEMFNIPENESSRAGYPSAQFLSLFDYFIENNNLKIKIFENVHSESPVITKLDSNSNRAYMYALLNDLPFTVIVPESYNTGIYQKINQDGFQYVSNIKYNVEYYTEDYINLRTIYNKLYTKILSDKLSSSLTYTFTDATIVIDGFSKFAFIDETNVNGSPNNYNVIYVNTTKADYERGPLQGEESVKLIYFKADTGRYLDVRLGNAIIYDTPGNDSIRIYSNNNVINSTYGTDIIEIVSGTVGNVVMLTDLIGTDKEQSLILRNNSNLEHSLTIKADNINFGDLVGKIADNKDFTLDFGNKVIILSGQTDLDIKGTQYNAAAIEALVKNFPELFTFAAGHNFVFNEQFIDDYIKITAKNFSAQLGYENTLSVSSEHAAYVLDKLTKYSQDMNDNDSLFIQEQKDKVTGKITSISTSLNVNGLQADILNMVMPLVKDKAEAASVAFTLQNKLNNFKYLNLSNQINMATIDNMADDTANNIYGKKETKNYISHYNSEGEVYYVWDGKYYYNRAVDGVQVAAFYDGEERGNLMNYYNENVTIKQSDLVANGINTSSIYGSDGSDILIGDNVNGQTGHRGTMGSNIVTDPKTVQNGNDILIGKEASAYSGDNFIYGSDAALGGSGNDLLIGGGRIYANQQFDNDTETTNNTNEIIILSAADVFSSNGKNSIVDLSSSGIGSNVFATANDTFIGGIGRSFFIGGYDAYLVLKAANISFDSDGRTFIDKLYLKIPYIDSFYNGHQTYTSGVNNIHAGVGGIDAILGVGDYLDNSKGGGGQIIALGNNDIFIKQNTAIISKGSSNITVTGDHNTLYLGKDDKYSLSNANNNNLYSRGYKDNINIGNDSYQLTGVSNTLILGKSSYSVKLDGTSSNVIFKQNDNYNKVIVNETGTTNITIGTQNSLSIETKNDVSLKNGTIGELIVNTNASVWFENIIANKLESNNYNGPDNTDIVTFYNMTVNDIDVRSGIITGSINDVLSANLVGTLGGFFLTGNDSGADIDITGFIDGVNNSFTNIKSFQFNQNIRIYEQPNISIEDSNIQDYTSTGNSRLGTINTNIETLTISGTKNSISVDGAVGIAKLTSSSELYFSAKSVKEVTATYSSTSIKASDVSGGVTLGLGMYGNSLMITDAAFVEVSGTPYGSIFLMATNSSVVNILGGFYNGIFTNVETVNIDLDNVSALSTFKGDNIHLTSTKSLALRMSNNKYYLNNVEFTSIPESVIVSGREYTSTQLAALFDVLKNSNVTQANAVIDSSGVAYDSIGDSQNDGVHIDNGIYVGTDNADMIYATDDKAYRIKAGKGDDNINFGTKPKTIYTHIIEYNRGDGFDTITSNTENIEIRLGNINSSELTFKMINDLVTNNKILQVYLAENQIFNIIGFESSNIQFKATDKTLSKSDVTNLYSMIYGTDNGEVIEGLLTDTYILADKGNDIINFIGSNKNVLYYNRGDGVDTINSIYAYEVIFGDDITRNQLTYIKTADNKFELYLDFRLINKVMTINDADKAAFKFKNGDILNGDTIISGNSILNQSYIQEKPFINDDGIYFGTDKNDSYDLNAIQQYHLYGGKGNDAYYFDEQNNFDNELDYYIGDGLDTIFNNYTKLKINLKDISVNDIRIEKGSVNNSLYIYYGEQKIMDVRDVLNSQITIQTIDSIIDSDHLKTYFDAPVESDVFYGTDSNDIIYGESGHINNIYGGKGDDTIIINEYDSNFAKNIYYNLGDGHDIISSEANFTLIFGDDIDSSKVTYEASLETEVFKIYYDNIKIITINKVLNTESTLYFKDTETSTIILNKVLESLTTVGTDGNDIINSNKYAEVISTGLGDDIININAVTFTADVNAGGGDDEINIFSTEADIMVRYNIGDGLDTINLNGYDNYILLNTDISKEKFVLKYDSTNTNTLNIYYIDDSNNEVHALIINNYIQDGTVTNDLTIMTSSGVITPNNIKDIIDANLTTNYSIDSLIDTMASLDHSDDNNGIGDGQSASSFMRKNE